jgi:hypothetical protein
LVIDTLKSVGYRPPAGCETHTHMHDRKKKYPKQLIC